MPSNTSWSSATTLRSRPKRYWSPRSIRWWTASLRDLIRAFAGHHADPLGHLIGTLSFARPRIRDGCFLYVTDRGLAHLLVTSRGYAAITFGHVIISTHEPSAVLWRHERRHVWQYERLGIAFIPLYLWYMLRHGYGAHPLERDASGAARLFDE